MSAVLPLAGAVDTDPRSDAILAQLLTDAFEGLDADIDHVRTALSRAVALVDGGSMPRDAIGRGGLAPWQARRISAVVEAGLEHGVGITDLAAKVQLSKSYFSRAFKAHFGRPPHQYILERRVARAQQLLLAGDLRVCEVAQACGFADQAHLSRMFRRRVGATPKAWRQARFGLKAELSAGPGGRGERPCGS